MSADERPFPVLRAVEDFFRHLSQREYRAAASLWDVPALILGDTVVHGPLSIQRLQELLD